MGVVIVERLGVIAATQGPGSLPLAISHDIFLLIFLRPKVFDILLHALGAHHASGLATAVDLIDLGTAVQVDLGIFVPGVRATAGTVDGARGQSVFIVTLPYGHVDVDKAEEGAALVVVATIDGTLHLLDALVDRRLITLVVGHLLLSDGVAHQQRIGTVVFHMALDDIAWLIDIRAVGTGEDAANLDGGACGDADHRTPHDTLAEAAAVGCTHLSAQQVDIGREQVF